MSRRAGARCSGRPFFAGATGALLALAVLGCAARTPVEIVRLPLREADLYPNAVKRAGIVVAIDEFSEPGRARNYFGTDLTEAPVLPVQIIISNHGAVAVRVRPADVILLRGNRQVIDPLPLEWVTATSTRGLAEETKKRMQTLLMEQAFAEAIVQSGETYHGVLFFRAPRPPEQGSGLLRVIDLFPQPRFQLRMVVTDIETDERVFFGPFRLEGLASRESIFPAARFRQ